jgi:histidinol-phosphate aminotransferase
VAAERDIALALAGQRDHLVAGLHKLPGVTVAGPPASGFVLIRVPDGVTVRTRLRRLGFAVRRGDSFPGLGPDWLRIAVRDTATSDSFLTALEVSLADHDVLGGQPC